MRTGKRIAFTVCSRNYLAQAQTLVASFRRHNPDWLFVIGLVDRPGPERAALEELGCEVLPVEDLGIARLNDLWSRYSIVELNTAVKPHYCRHLLRREGVEYVMYLDPDTRFYSSADSILIELSAGAVLLTPHALTPLPRDGAIPSDNVFLKYGIYNLGFLCVAKQEETLKVLSWWEENTVNAGHSRTEDGQYVDQLCMNLAPVYFEGVRVSKNAGLNVAYWNLHERHLAVDPDGTWRVNGKEPLVFFHFSSLEVENAETIAKHQDRFSLSSRPELRELVEGYVREVCENGWKEYRGVDCEFMRLRKRHLERLAVEKRRLAFRRGPLRALARTFVSEARRKCDLAFLRLERKLSRSLDEA